MPESMQIISQRIITAVRVAVAMHLYASAGVNESRQPVEIGGAGPRFSTDGSLPGGSRESRLAPNAGGAE